jgi:hypothetical protein
MSLALHIKKSLHCREKCPKCSQFLSSAGRALNNFSVLLLNIDSLFYYIEFFK